MSQSLKIASASKVASRKLSSIDPNLKNKFLNELAIALVENADKILAANSEDLSDIINIGAKKAFIDRLTLSKERILSLSQAVESISNIEDPVGKILETRNLQNGLSIKKITVPFGNILIVYESRPNVTVDAACLCLKSGNAVILRGGKECLRTNKVLCSIMQSCLLKSNLPENSITLLEDSDRSLIYELLTLEKQIDLVIPRGGESLVTSVTQHSRIPVLKNAKGLCHTFIDESAEIDMALKICENAKTQRPAVCNAMETLLVHKKIAESFMPKLVKIMEDKSVELRGDSASRNICSTIKPAMESDWDEEYGDLILAIRIVDSLDQAIEHISAHGSGHSEAIVTNSEINKVRFLSEIDAAAVYSNASTRFTDGGEFGLGAEIGISTGKLHARGPMGVRELTSYKYIIEGSGQIR